MKNRFPFISQFVITLTILFGPLVTSSLAQQCVPSYECADCDNWHCNPRVGYCFGGRTLTPGYNVLADPTSPVDRYNTQDLERITGLRSYCGSNCSKRRGHSNSYALLYDDASQNFKKYNFTYKKGWGVHGTTPIKPGSLVILYLSGDSTATGYFGGVYNGSTGTGFSGRTTFTGFVGLAGAQRPDRFRWSFVANPIPRHVILTDKGGSFQSTLPSLSYPVKAGDIIGIVDPRAPKRRKVYKYNGGTSWTGGVGLSGPIIEPFSGFFIYPGS